MKIYLAADYARKEEMQGVRDVLSALGHIITSQWIDRPSAIRAFGIGGARIDLKVCMEITNSNICDLRDADMVLLFTSGELSRGGRHTEFGMALAWKKSICIIGPREHSFHSLPYIRQYDSWPMFLINQFQEAFFK